MEPEAVRAVLENEAAEINNYVRMYFQTYVAWFTFFITVLFTSMAWALKTAFDDNRRVKWGLPVYLVYGLFSMQIILGVLGTWRVRADVIQAHARVATIQTALAQGRALAPESPVPRSFAFVLLLMAITLISNIVFWGVVVIAVRRLEKRRR